MTTKQDLLDFNLEETRAQRTSFASTSEENSPGFFDAIRPALASRKYLALKERKNPGDKKLSLN
jgi:hypothetical protein